LDDSGNFGAWLAEKDEVENKTGETNKISLTDSYRMSLDVGPEFGKRSTNLVISQKNNRIEIPRI